MAIDGAIACALVDYESGTTLAMRSGRRFCVDIAASDNAMVVRIKASMMKAFGIRDSIEDIVVTLATQYHIVRPLHGGSDVFLYVAVDRETGNLAMARRQMASLAATNAAFAS